MLLSKLMLLFSSLIGISAGFQINHLNGLKFIKANHYPQLTRGETLKSESKLAEIRDQISVPSDSICNAIDRSNRVTIPDVAVASGCDLRTARNGIMQLASITGATLEVTNDGEIVYSFPPNFRALLLKRSLGQKLKLLIQTVIPPLYTLVRVSFGLFLIASLMIIISSFVIISSGSSSSRDDDSRSSRSRSSFSLNFSPDLFYYRPREERRFHNKSFLESFFAFVFGDGDPNADLKSISLRECADIIRQNNGVVVAEQLAPYLDPPQLSEVQTNDASGGLVKEDWVLPVVLQLDGEPTVTEDGTIVYAFPEIIKTATGTTTSKRRSYYDKDLLEEKIIPFNDENDGNNYIAMALGVFNLFGSIWLSNKVLDPILMGGLSATLQLGLKSISPVLLTYGILYNLIPLLRYIKQEVDNKEIRARNNKRKEWANYLKSRSVQLTQKLLAAKEFQESKKMAMVPITKDDIVYSTADDDSEEEKGKKALKDFDDKYFM